MRRYRVVHAPNTPEPWIVQAAERRTDTWSDVARFNERADTTRYIQQVKARQTKDEERRRERLNR